MFDLKCTIVPQYLQKNGQATLDHALIDYVDYHNTLMCPAHVNNNIRRPIPTDFGVLGVWCKPGWDTLLHHNPTLELFSLNF